MKVEISPPSAVEAQDITVAEDGSGISMTPLFYGNGVEATTVGVLKIHSDTGNLVYLGVLKVSGTGKPSLQERTRPVVPKLDRKKK
jgi:hypothetical protein